jgi:GTP-binding protein
VDTIRDELAAHSAQLHRRPWLLVGTKMDAVSDRDRVQAELEGVAVEQGVSCCAISAVTGEGVSRLVGMLFEMVEESEAS